MSSASTTNQQVRKPLVDRFSYLLRKCSSSTSTTTKAFPIINRRTLIGSGIAANLRIRDPANVDMIQAEIYQFHDPNTGEKSNELKPISMTKPTFVNDQEIFGDTLLKHMDRITFGTTTTTATEMKRHDFIFEIHKIQHSTTSTSTPRTTATMKSPSSSSSTSLISLNKSLTRNGTKSKMIQKQQQQKLELRVETLRKNHLVATTSLKASEIVNMKQQQQQQQHRPKQLSLNENLTTNSSNQQVTNNAMNNDDKWQYHDDQQVQEQQQQSSLMMDQSSKTMLSSFNERFYSESMPSIFVMATPSSIISTPFSQHNKRKWSTTTTTTAGHFDIDPSDDNETPKKSDQCNNNRLLPMSLLTLNLNLTPTTIDHERKTNLTTFKQQQQQQQRIRIMDQTGVLGLGQKQREIVVKV